MCPTTAHAMSAKVERCLESGMNDHVNKSVDLDALMRTLRRWWKGWEKLRL